MLHRINTRERSVIFLKAARYLTVQMIFVSCSFFAGAQSYQGYHSSTYTGVYGILTNPTDILNHRFRGDINLVGFSTQVNNNLVTLKLKNGDNNNVIYPNPVTKTAKLNFNTDIFGPSFLIRLSDKHAFAITTRARVMANVRGIGSNLLNLTIQDSLEQSLINADLSINNIATNAHAWTELALTYSRQVGISDYGVWKAGVSLKYLSGAAAFSLVTNKLAFTYTDSLAGLPTARAAITNLRGNIALDYTKNVDSLDGDLKNYFFKNPGIGLDIGLNYEYRDEMQVYETAYSDEIRNYVWKAGISITDIGFIRYNKQQTGGFGTTFKGNTYLTDTLKPPSDSTSIQQMANYYRNLFGIRDESSVMTMQLPTMLHLTYDRFFNKVLGIQAQLNVPLVFSPSRYYRGTFNPLSVSVTPRAEISWCGFYLPIAYNSYAGLQVGAAIRLGPLVIGSGSLINTKFLNRTKSADAYFILRIPFFGYREYKEKVKKDHSKLSKEERKALDCPAN